MLFRLTKPSCYRYLISTLSSGCDIKGNVIHPSKCSSPLQSPHRCEAAKINSGMLEIKTQATIWPICCFFPPPFYARLNTQPRNNTAWPSGDNLRLKGFVPDVHCTESLPPPPHPKACDAAHRPFSTLKKNPPGSKWERKRVEKCLTLQWHPENLR